jgi:hypothetical protein
VHGNIVAGVGGGLRRRKKEETAAGGGEEGRNRVAGGEERRKKDETAAGGGEEGRTVVWKKEETRRSWVEEKRKKEEKGKNDTTQLALNWDPPSIFNLLHGVRTGFATKHSAASRT